MNGEAGGFFLGGGGGGEIGECDQVGVETRTSQNNVGIAKCR